VVCVSTLAAIYRVSAQAAPKSTVRDSKDRQGSVLRFTPYPVARVPEISPVAAVASMVVVGACHAIDGATWQGAGWKVLSLTGNHNWAPGTQVGNEGISGLASSACPQGVLAACFSAERLSARLPRPGSWHPYPAIRDRAAWDVVHHATRDHVLG
jgi:hypothetical protein